MSTTERESPAQPQGEATDGVDLAAIQAQWEERRGGAPPLRNPQPARPPSRAGPSRPAGLAPLAGSAPSGEVVSLSCGRCTDAEGAATRFDWTRIVVAGRQIAPDPDLCPACLRAEDAQAVEAEIRARTGAVPAGAADGEVSMLERVERAGGNPTKCRGRSLEAFEPHAGNVTGHRAAVDWTRAVLDRPDRFAPVRNLLLWGGWGRAKTVLAHLSLRDLLAAGVQPGPGVLYEDFGSLIGRVQGSYGARAEESSWKIMDRLIRTDVAFIDDIFADKVTADSVRILLLILNRREDRPTFLATNEDPAALWAKYGQRDDFGLNLGRLLSRLGGFRMVEMKGQADGRFAAEAPRV